MNHKLILALNSTNSSLRMPILFDRLNFRIAKNLAKQMMMHLEQCLERSSLINLGAMEDQWQQEEINKLKQKHANEITFLKEEMRE